MPGGRVEDPLRTLAPQVLGALARRYGHFDACEDAVQEALLAASRQWPAEGMPDNPKSWLITVASRRLTDQLRGDSARRRREEETVALVSRDADEAPTPHAVLTDPLAAGSDDTLTLLFMCCHPAISAASQLALTLRAVGGLTTGEIANAFFVPETTMGQRISRAKQTIKAAGTPFRLPPVSERTERLRVVLQVLYLIFSEGHTATAGTDLVRADLTAEAIRLTRAVHRSLPGDGEVSGLLALMLLTDARRRTRVGEDGGLVALADQDRTRWDADEIAEGVVLVTEALSTGQVGPYQLQAAIAAVHDEAASAAETDWSQILALYDVLERISPNPMAALNRAVAVAEVHGPRAGLDVIERLSHDRRIAEHHRLDAVRAHLLEQLGDVEGAVAAYRRAARRTTSVPEQRYLEARAVRAGR